MKKNTINGNNFISDISQRPFSTSQKVVTNSISDSFLLFIQITYPHFNENSCLSISELSALRVQFISSKLKGQLGELTSMENLVIETLSNGDEISNIVLSQDNTPLSRG